MFALLDAAERLAAGEARPGDLDAVAEAIAFLERSAPRHFADEEESLFPRAVARDPSLGKTLARITAEHVDHGRHHARLRELFDAWDGDVPAAADAATMLAEARALDEEYGRHVAEEDQLFETIRAVLTEADLAEIAAEMDGRRGRRR
jgi:hemerythrin-like domain-containing protein